MRLLGGSPYIFLTHGEETPAPGPEVLHPGDLLAQLQQLVIRRNLQRILLTASADDCEASDADLDDDGEGEEAEWSEADEGAEAGDEEDAGLAADEPVPPARRQVQEVGGQQRGDTVKQPGRFRYHKVGLGFVITGVLVSITFQ